jgi:uncharacterized protein YndB with AHSA1/START domain
MTATTKQEMRKAKVELKGERDLHIERIFDAPRERVWKAHADPALVAQWWGRGNTLDVQAFEFRKGGHWRFVEHSEGQQHGFEGRFREIEPMDRLEMTFEYDGWPGHVSVDRLRFEDLGDGRTRLTCHTTFLEAADRDGMVSSGMEGGMNESYQALDRLLASMAA